MDEIDNIRYLKAYLNTEPEAEEIYSIEWKMN
jgi:hypothetical protein